MSARAPTRPIQIEPITRNRDRRCRQTGEVGRSSRRGERDHPGERAVRIGATGSVEGAVAAPRLVMADRVQLQGRVDVQTA